MTQDRNPLSPDAVGLEGLFEGMILDIHYANGHTSRATVTSRVFHRFRADMGNLPSVSLRWHAGGECSIGRR